MLGLLMGDHDVLVREYLSTFRAFFGIGVVSEFSGGDDLDGFSLFFFFVLRLAHLIFPGGFFKLFFVLFIFFFFFKYNIIIFIDD